MKACAGHTPPRRSSVSSSHPSGGPGSRSVNTCLCNITGKYCTFTNAAASSVDQYPKLAKGTMERRMTSVDGPDPDPLSPGVRGNRCPTKCHLFIVDGAVLGEVFVLAACPAKQNHNRLLCLLPVSLWEQNTPLKGRICHGHSRRGPGERGRRDFTCSQTDYAPLGQIMSPCERANGITTESGSPDVTASGNTML